MTFTPLHRALGEPAGPITFEMLARAIEIGVSENEELDWKQQLPPETKFGDSDIVKDIAAMANRGGGMIVFGIAETNKAATAWGPTECAIDEGYERTIRQVSWSKISPSVLGLTTGNVEGPDGETAAWILIPPSDESPHLLFDKDRFRAPMREGADTKLLKEREIEAMYRARFDTRLRVSGEMGELHRRAVAGRDTSEMAWLIGVARPRFTHPGRRLKRETATRILLAANGQLDEMLPYAQNFVFMPVDMYRPIKTYRGWVFGSSGASHVPHSTAVSVFDDASVTFAAAVGGADRRGIFDDPADWAGEFVDASRLEEVIAGFTCTVRSAAETSGHDEYDLRVSLEWTGTEVLQLLSDGRGRNAHLDGRRPMRHFVPVERSINARSELGDFLRTTHHLALDCVNQGGQVNLVLLNPDVS